MTFLAPLVKGPTEPCVLRHLRTGIALASTIEPAFDPLGRKRGLLGRSGIEPGVAMILAPCAAVHTFFMRFPIDVIFVRRDGTVMKVSGTVKPWRIAIGWGAFAAIECRAGTAAHAGIRRGDALSIELFSICP